MRGQTENMGNRDRIGKNLSVLYVLCLIVVLFLIGRLIYIQAFWKPDPTIESLVTPHSQKVSIDPDRGAILAEDGRLLAMTVPSYDIHMDCTVQSDKEDEWQRKAAELAEGLAGILQDKSADQYLQLIRNGRKARNGYLRICSGIDHKKYVRIAALPLFNEGKFRGGFISEREMVRMYPYGKLARRTIGFVRNNKSTVGNKNVGIEGKFDYRLHGKEGEQYVRITDNNTKVQDFGKDYRPAEDGMDVKTTLNIDYQDIADRALRSKIEGEPDIEGGCLVLMEVETGAIRAMVNLLRDTTSNTMEEIQNLAIGRRGEPGSVFKTVTLTSVLSDYFSSKDSVTLDKKIPTNRGHVKNANFKWRDDHVDRFGSEISIIDGFKISSNYVFATLAIEYYSSKPQKYIDNVYMYKLGEAFDFDLDGLRTPEIPRPGTAAWSGNTTLGSIGFGYSTGETPLHILTFYNALANRGKMMRPYLVEDIEQHGSIIEKRGPSVLNASICPAWVADTVKRALSAVTEEGTARKLKNNNIAGKTGTSFAVIETNADPKNPYKDKYGRQKYQGTFVGFFPIEEPKYSIICTVYSKPTSKSFQGGGLPADAVKEVVDKIHDIDPYWVTSIGRSGEMSRMQQEDIAVTQGEVPDVKGYGLMDAIYAIENAGFKCSYSGTGHVKTQSTEGNIVHIVLK